MRKIAVLADIHGNILALDAVVEDLQHRGIDTVVTLGDHISGPLWPGETARFLMKQTWFQIAGNHDRQLVTRDEVTYGATDMYADSVISDAERGWLRSLPSSLAIGSGILLFHGTPANDTDYLTESIGNGKLFLSSINEITARLGSNSHTVLLCGHTHIPRVVHLPNGKLIVNPGSVGLPAYTDIHPQEHNVENGSPAARYAIMEQLRGHWIIELVTIPYDHEKAAEQAKRNNRPEWEFWLRTGFALKA